MTETADTTMADAETADTTFKTVTSANKSKRLKATLVQKETVERTHSFTIRVYFPPPQVNTKFNPISSMHSFFKEVIKYKPTLVIVNQKNMEQIDIAKTPLPTNEEDFKKYFVVTNDARAGKHKQHLIVGCNILSERTFRDIKFDKTKPQLLEWMKKEKIFVESDNLGVHKTTTIGYLTQLHPDLTNRTILKELLRSALDDVIIDANLAVELDPSLKTLHQQAKANGDSFNPELPIFEVYKTRISYSHEKQKVSTDIIAIKCAHDKARLLKEFYSQLASPENYEKQIGVFVPTGTAHTIGSEKYAKLLSDNNAFLQSVVTILVGDFSHETLDIPFSTDTMMDINQTTLMDIIMEQTWCLNIEKTSIHNKVLLTMTKAHLETARKWVNTTLPSLYQQNIADKLDVTTIKKTIPRRLDKPTLTVASMAYADKLKQRMTGPNDGKGPQTLIARPPCQNKFQPVDVTFDEREFPELQTSKTKPASSKPKPQTTTQTTTTTTATDDSTPQPFDYKAELLRLSDEIETKLKKQFEALFHTMELKIDDLAKQNEQYRQEQKLRFEDQEVVNATVTKQLTYLVDNMKSILKYATPTNPFVHPSSNDDGKL